MGPSGGGGGGDVVVSDNFNRSDGDLGASWGTQCTDFDVASNEARWIADCDTNGYGYVGYNTTVGSVDQWVKIQYVTTISNSKRPALLMRMPDASWSSGDVAYEIEINSSGFTFINELTHTENRVNLAGGTQITAIGDGDYFYAMVTGTGASTVWKVWTGTTDPGNCNTADADCGWGTPDVTYTDDPGADAVDTGNFMGFGLEDNDGAVTVEIDNFSGGNN